MPDIAELKIEVGLNAEKATTLLSLVEKASIANKALQSALEEISKSLLSGGLELQNLHTGSRCLISNLESLATDASDDLPVMEPIESV